MSKELTETQEDVLNEVIADLDGITTYTREAVSSLDCAATVECLEDFGTNLDEAIEMLSEALKAAKNLKKEFNAHLKELA